MTKKKKKSTPIKWLVEARKKGEKINFNPRRHTKVDKD